MKISHGRTFRFGWYMPSQPCPGRGPSSTVSSTVQAQLTGIRDLTIEGVIHDCQLILRPGLRGCATSSMRLMSSCRSPGPAFPPSVAFRTFVHLAACGRNITPFRSMNSWKVPKCEANPGAGALPWRSSFPQHGPAAAIWRWQACAVLGKSPRSSRRTSTICTKPRVCGRQGRGVAWQFHLRHMP